MNKPRITIKESRNFKACETLRIISKRVCRIIRIQGVKGSRILGMGKEPNFIAPCQISMSKINGLLPKHEGL